MRQVLMSEASDLLRPHRSQYPTCVGIKVDRVEAANLILYDKMKHIQV